VQCAFIGIGFAHILETRLATLDTISNELKVCVYALSLY
jgi:hypothetical protein